MAAPVESVTSKMEAEAGPFPGYPDTESFVKYALGKVITTTKSSTGLPQSGDEYDFYRSYPGFRSFCETQGDRLLHCMSRIMQYHGCRSYTGERNKHSVLEDKMDLLVDANDAILERVSMMLDEASGVHRSQEPILPAGLQAPKTIISSWNRESFDSKKNYKTQTFRLLQAKNILRPQMKFKEKIDNTNTPFVPKIFIKPNAQKPLPESKDLPGRFIVATSSCFLMAPATWDVIPTYLLLSEALLEKFAFTSCPANNRFTRQEVRENRHQGQGNEVTGIGILSTVLKEMCFVYVAVGKLHSSLQ